MSLDYQGSVYLFEELLRKFLSLIYPFATSSWVNNEANFSLANLSSPYDNLFSIVTENELLSETLASQAQRTTNYLFKVNSKTMWNIFKLIVDTPDGCHWRHSDIFIIDYEDV